ncbi:peptidase S16 [Ferrovibrio terrae]|uniref:Peptidase S16 n=1 Tax=Ferrovibrio terrae TaxID=2594003 RepID=A0A516GXJ8_9PROT|nr:LON peptidase substrate-binding domain-containing protein [Ferrovibrio terrae]QDO96060.1 peptidase S16 [Ferrovibrio terrae]
MHESQCPSSIAELTATIPIFPLTGVLLLPRGLLPLNIFEPRYLAMTRAALNGAKLIGMLQPTEPFGRDGQSPPKNSADVYGTGCVGKIVSATETDDGRMLLTLKGLCRFNVTREVDTETPYRQVEADYAPYAGDMAVQPDGLCDRNRLIHALSGYCARHNLPADWESITAVNDDLLVHSLAMICPFTAGEKQALLEATDFKARAALLVGLLEMAMLDHSTLPRGAKPN